MNNTSKVLAGIVVLLTVLTACASRDGSRFSASQALDDAVNAAQQADQLGYLWLSTDELIAQAEQALAEGEDERAIELAVQAERQAELAIDQYYLEKAKLMFERLSQGEHSQVEMLKLRAAEDAINATDGKLAYDILVEF